VAVAGVVDADCANVGAIRDGATTELGGPDGLSGRDLGVSIPEMSEMFMGPPRTGVRLATGSMTLNFHAPSCGAEMPLSGREPRSMQVNYAN